MTATVTLPEYLGRPEKLEKDVRGGALTLVRHSTATFAITASRDLATADIDGEILSPTGPSLATTPIDINESRQLAFEWRDKFGLAGREPFGIAITAQDNAPPSLACDSLPRQKVVLASETLTFKVRRH